jgi:hypothetical protein
LPRLLVIRVYRKLSERALRQPVNGLQCAFVRRAGACFLLLAASRVVERDHLRAVESEPHRVVLTEDSYVALRRVELQMVLTACESAAAELPCDSIGE